MDVTKNSSAPQLAAAEVLFPSGKKATKEEGLTLQDVAAAPTVMWSAEDDAFYTVTIKCSGPNKTDPKNEEWLYWMVVNIPGTDISKGEIIVEYSTPRPSKSTQNHYYVVSVFKQPGKKEFNQKKITAKDTAARAKFQVKPFQEKHNLGEPIAGNSFQMKSS